MRHATPTFPGSPAVDVTSRGRSSEFLRGAGTFHACIRQAAAVRRADKALQWVALIG
jgi:hypothetical protein